MHLSVFTLIALFALSAVRAVHSGRPSNVPSCTFTCPPRDQFGYPVGVHRNDGTTLFCIYPSVEGAKNPNDYFCKYFSTTGKLKKDNDSRLCPSTAVASCSTRHGRRNALSQPPALPKEEPVALAPVVIAPNNNMKVRAQIKKRHARIPSFSSS